MARAQLVTLVGRVARLVLLGGALSAAAVTPACVCTPVEGEQECEASEQEDTYPVSGLVTIDGAPRAGVWLVPSSGDSVRSRISGDFYFDLPTSSSVTVRPPAGTAFLRSTLHVGLTDRDSLHFEGYSLARVSGHVRFMDQPVPGVAIRLGNDRTTESDSDGAYAFADVPPSPDFVDYDLSIASGPPGIRTGRVAFLKVRGTDVVRDIDVDFLGGATISGRVHAGEVGIANVIVTAIGPFVLVDTTGADGRYAFPYTALGEYTVMVSGFDPETWSFQETSRVVELGEHAVVDFEATILAPNEPPVPVITAPLDGATFVQGTPIAFSGGATDPEDGALSGGSLVWTEGAGVPLGTGSTVTADSLSALEHRIWLTATDSRGRSAATSIVITVVESAEPGSISGTVTANGYGIGDVRIRLSGAATASTTTDGDAEYSFENLPPGTYTVRISGYPSGVSFPATSVTINLAPGEHRVIDFAGSY